MSLDDATLHQLVERAAHLLPAQGPITIFIHHNTLHAFEEQPFEQAVVDAGRALSREPFMDEEYYREALARGRVRDADVCAMLRAELGGRGDDLVCGTITRLELRRRIARFGVPLIVGKPLDWILSETNTLWRFRRDLPDDARARLFGDRDARTERRAVRALWDACVSAAPPGPPVEQTPAVRHRDLVAAATGVDIDEWVHPLLIRFTSAFLDQGLAHWAMPERERGMRSCFAGTYGGWAAPLCGAWARRLPELLARDREAPTALASIDASLRALEVGVDERGEYLAATALALRGWAGMVRQIEERPDRVPTHPVPATLADFLAVRLLLERAALDALRSTRPELVGTYADVRRRLAAVPPPDPPRAAERAWPLFQLAQLCGLDAAAPELADQLARMAVDWTEHDLTARRRVLHLAYERALRHHFYDALIDHRIEDEVTPDFQAVFCIDEREESFRRHLEEVAPDVETYGAAGFFGVAMYYKGATDAHARPLCPVSIRPHHYVAEDHEAAPRAQLATRGLGTARRTLHIGTRKAVAGALLTSLFGVVASIPAVLRVLFPRLGAWLARAATPAPSTASTRLRLERDPAQPPLGTVSGYTVDEMVDIVHGLLGSIGIADRLAPLVVVLGHGSVSVNNPQESAHDCGACGGGRGGPNARAFAQMANDDRVRARLAELELSIGAGTWFVGAERNTCNNRVSYYDTDRIPDALQPAFSRARAAISQARRREAHERCRRFEAAPTGTSPNLALMHVQGRSVDLAQPRPEYGHASNALCVVGRRARTRGLFLDRRAFLVSYDPSRDADGGVLTGLLAAVVPVVAGINLEYYFSYVDPSGYGCGTKLPHNVTSLLGVMDGAQSDLRTGLPWQMVEIHEPVRLSLVVECSWERLRAAIDSTPSVRQLIANRWIFVACIDPSTAELYELSGDRFERYVAEEPVAVVTGPSAAVYRQRRDHLPFVSLRAPGEGGR